MLQKLKDLFNRIRNKLSRKGTESISTVADMDVCCLSNYYLGYIHGKAEAKESEDQQDAGMEMNPVYDKGYEDGFENGIRSVKTDLDSIGYAIASQQERYSNIAPIEAILAQYKDELRYDNDMDYKIVSRVIDALKAQGFYSRKKRIPKIEAIPKNKAKPKKKETKR